MKTDIALLLCAGFGTRMGELTRDTPKPLLPVVGRPVLDYLLDQLRGLEGLTQIHVVGNALHFDALESWAAERRGALEPELIVHNDGSTDNTNRLGAVGDLGFVLDRLDGLPDGALVAAGDNILRFALAPLWQRFRETRLDFVLAIPENDPERLRKTGILVLDEEERVLEFHEKPAEPPSRWTCPPFYFLTGEALAQVQPHLAAEQGKNDEIGHFVATLTAQKRIRAFCLETPTGERLRLDIGSPDSYRSAEEVLGREAVFLASGKT